MPRPDGKRAAMHGFYLLGLAEGVVLGLMAAAGAAAVRGGWVPRWERHRVLRTRLWGQSVLVATGSLAVPAVVLSLLGPGVVWFAATAAGSAGVVVAAALARRAGRDRRGAAKPASF
jgi:hypothetical protein